MVAGDSRSSGQSTKDKIIEVAGRLFVADGFSDASMRRITKEAGLALGAVNYHFGSKEGLFEAVVERQFGPLLVQRADRLQKLELNPRPGDVAYVRAIIESWLDPLLDHLSVHPEHINTVYAIDRVLSARASAPGIFKTVSPYQMYLTRFGSVLQKAVPHLDLAEIYWRFHFMIGAVTHVLSARNFVTATTEGRCDPSRLAELRAEVLTAFLRILGFSDAEGSGSAMDGSRTAGG